ncbi:MAG: 23S rRNA (pseudouridine(1915)-N(3))-methyltransferase RlmH [Pseudomonadota bacterium]
MRLTVAAIGKLSKGPERALCERYATRINAKGRSVALGPLAAREFREATADQPAVRKRSEAAQLRDAARQADRTIVLDEGGKTLSSSRFARWLREARDTGVRETAFLIGGPDGHDESVLAGADLRLALGPMTLPHALARAVLMEQIYRAITIVAGHPYHRE